MVKNVAPMDSLRNTMSGMGISSPPNTQPRQPATQPLYGYSPETQTSSDPPMVNLRQPVQMVGSDQHTKWLMNRIATGVATAQEKAAWEQHVAMLKQQRLSAASLGAQPMGSQPPSYTSPPVAPADPRGQPMRYQRMDGTFGSRYPPPDATEGRETPAQTAFPHARHDFEMQLMLLEQQDRNRLLMARAEQDASAAWDTPPHSMDDVKPPLSTANPCSREVASATRQAMQESYSKEVQTAMGHQEQLPTGTAAGCPSNSKPLKQATRQNAAKYTKPFCDFLTNNPTVFHAVDAIKTQLNDAGFSELSERDSWDLEAGGSYYVDRNGSSLIAFTVGGNYQPGNGAAILAGHVDALTAKLKPISQVPNKAGYLQLGVAPYAGAPNTTWWDRDLSIGGRVLVKEGNKIVSKLVKLDWPIARIPTLAPHFGAAAYGPFNPETQMVPIIGLESTDASATDIQTAEPFSNPPILGSASGGPTSFAASQPPKLVEAIGKALGLRTDTYSTIVNWELELYDYQPATVGGLDKEFIFAGRIDDKLCSWAAVQALIESTEKAQDSSIIQVVGLFDDEEIGSLLRQGARGNFLPTVIERTAGSFAGHNPGSDLIGRTYANSFLVSSDVTHAVNPNFLGAYLENHAPHLNVGVVVSADSNGHMTTDAVSTAILKRCADKVGAQLQLFQIRNDSRSGGTVGPMLSAATGIRAIDAGIPQLSMHSIRATTGALDPGLGVILFSGFLNGFEEVDKEFRV